MRLDINKALQVPVQNALVASGDSSDQFNVDAGEAPVGSAV